MHNIYTRNTVALEQLQLQLQITMLGIAVNIPRDCSVRTGSGDHLSSVWLFPLRQFLILYNNLLYSTYHIR